MGRARGEVHRNANKGMRPASPYPDPTSVVNKMFIMMTENIFDVEKKSVQKANLDCRIPATQRTNQMALFSSRPA
jgi:hypothetical protein